MCWCISQAGSGGLLQISSVFTKYVFNMLEMNGKILISKV